MRGREIDKDRVKDFYKFMMGTCVTLFIAFTLLWAQHRANLWLYSMIIVACFFILFTFLYLTKKKPPPVDWGELIKRIWTR